jgi:hypothetical protein
MNFMMTRRDFAKRSVLTVVGLRLAQGAALVGVAEMEVSCNLFNDILNWVPVGEAAVNSILAVLTSNGIVIAPGVQAIVTAIEAAFTDLTGAVQEYQSTTPAPVGALAKIETAFKAVVDNFSSFLNQLGVSGGLLAIVVGLAQVVFSTITAFMNQLPASSSLKRTLVLGATFKVAGATATIVPKLRTRRVFKKDFNSVLDTGARVGAVIPKSAYLSVTFWEHF